MISAAGVEKKSLLSKAGFQSGTNAYFCAAVIAE
jgi:hypothetical protein